MKAVLDLLIAAISALFEKVGQKLTMGVCGLGTIAYLSQIGQLDLYRLIAVVVITVAFFVFRIEESKLKNPQEVK